ncbi:cyclic nucleotide-binding domain-containing protein [Endothiovibrio diazotrophicus]
MKSIGPLSVDELERLVERPPFSLLDTLALETLLHGAREVHVEAGERIAEAGAAQPDLYLLLEGAAAEGERPLHPGDLLGAATLMEGRCWPAETTAREPLRLAQLDGASLRRACCTAGAALERLPALRPLVLEQRYLSQALRDSVVFSDLEPPLLRDLETTMALATVRAGAPVLREGEPSDSMVMVVSGRLRASRTVDGVTERLAEIGPGEGAGEAGMVLRQPRSADVVAVRDSTLAWLPREPFERLLARHPVALNRAVARVIFQFARGAVRPLRHSARTLAVVPLHAGPAAGRFARELCDALSSAGRAHLLTPAEGRALHAGEGAAAIGRLSDLEHRYDYLIYEAEAEPTPWSCQAARQADHLLLVADAGADPAPWPIERALAGEPGFGVVRKSLVLIHHAPGGAPPPTGRWRAGRDLERVYPLREGERGDVERLARFLSDRAVGVVLGGGGARGFAHIGVLRALAEAQIPVDIIGGNSMGALIAAQYALGLPLAEIQRWTRKFILAGEMPALPLVSLVAGRRLERDLRARFGETAIEAMWHPYFAVSCNLSRAAMRVHDEGPLWQAVLASNSPAGILPPVVQGGDLLVDGALLDNVPVEAMRERIGGGPLIAVDVDVREELSVDPSLSRIPVWQALKQRLRGVEAPERLPGIVDLLTRAGHIGGLARRERQIELADHYLQPPVSGFPMLGYRRNEEIAEVGYRYAAVQIAAWDSLPGR